MPTATKNMLRTALGLTLSLTAVNCDAETGQAPVIQVTLSKDPAVALVQQVARAYQEAPAIADDFEITMKSRGRERTDTSVVRLGPGTDARVTMEGYEITALDGQLTIKHVDRPTKYLQVPLVGNLLESFVSLAGGNGLPVPQAALRYGKTTEDYVAAFGLARGQGLTIRGIDTVERDGKTFEQLTLSNGQGVDVTALIDPDTKFIDTIALKTLRSEFTARMATKRLDRLPESLAVNTADRRQVESIHNLMNLSAGDDAPDFTLETLDGEEVSLADHRGSLVVVDFWATWCGPCKMGLPRLQEFATWAKKEGHAVTVLPVDMGERQRTRDAKKAAVTRFWKAGGFTMQTLMDYDDTTARAFQVTSIPHMVVVDPQGKIIKVEIGFNRNAVDHLKELTRQTFGG